MVYGSGEKSQHNVLSCKLQPQHVAQRCDWPGKKKKKIVPTQLDVSIGCSIKFSSYISPHFFFVFFQQLLASMIAFSFYIPSDCYVAISKAAINMTKEGRLRLCGRALQRGRMRILRLCRCRYKTDIKRIVRKLSVNVSTGLSRKYQQDAAL